MDNQELPELQEIVNHLKRANSVIINDDVQVYPVLNFNIKDIDEIFLELKWERDGKEYLYLFTGKDNIGAKYINNSMRLINTLGEEIKLTPLFSTLI